MTVKNKRQISVGSISMAIKLFVLRKEIFDILLFYFQLFLASHCVTHKVLE